MGEWEDWHYLSMPIRNNRRIRIFPEIFCLNAMKKIITAKESERFRIAYQKYLKGVKQ